MAKAATAQITRKRCENAFILNRDQGVTNPNFSPWSRMYPAPHVLP